MERDIMSEKGVYDDYTRLSNQADNARTLGSWLKRLFKKKNNDFFQISVLYRLLSAYRDNGNALTDSQTQSPQRLSSSFSVFKSIISDSLI